MTTFPRIDPSVEYVGGTRLRRLNATALRKLTNLLVISDSSDKPLAVLVPYELFMRMQDARREEPETR